MMWLGGSRQQPLRSGEDGIRYCHSEALLSIGQDWQKIELLEYGQKFN